MIPLPYIVIGAGLGLLALFGKSEEEPPTVGRHRRIGPHRSPFYSCGQFPWLQEDVDHVLQALMDRGVHDPDDLTRRTLQEVYQTTPEGEPIRWPLVPGDCVQVRAIYARVLLRARLASATWYDERAEDAWAEGGGR